MLSQDKSSRQSWSTSTCHACLVAFVWLVVGLAFTCVLICSAAQQIAVDSARCSFFLCIYFFENVI